MIDIFCSAVAMVTSVQQAVTCVQQTEFVGEEDHSNIRQKVNVRHWSNFSPTTSSTLEALESDRQYPNCALGINLDD
jgi:hypothetical protein